MKMISVMIVLSITAFIGCKEENVRFKGKEVEDNKIVDEMPEGDPTIEFRYGVAFKEGRVLYLDPEKMDQKILIITSNYAKKYKKENYKIIPAGKIVWGWGIAYVYDTKIESPRSEIWESEKQYIYTIENNTLYVSTDEKNWEKVEVTVVDENPPQEYGPNTCPVYMIVHLKCKFFENDYEIIGPVRDDLKYQKHKKK